MKTVNSTQFPVILNFCTKIINNMLIRQYWLYAIYQVCFWLQNSAYWLTTHANHRNQSGHIRDASNLLNNVAILFGSPRKLSRVEILRTLRVTFSRSWCSHHSRARQSYVPMVTPINYFGSGTIVYVLHNHKSEKTNCIRVRCLTRCEECRPRLSTGSWTIPSTWLSRSIRSWVERDPRPSSWRCLSCTALLLRSLPTSLPAHSTRNLSFSLIIVITIIITPPRRSYVTLLFVCLSVCLSFVCSDGLPASRIAYERVYGCDPLEVTKLWCRSGCESTISFFIFLNIRRWAFYTIYCHSPDGDCPAALAEYYHDYYHSPHTGCYWCLQSTIFNRQCQRHWAI